MFERLLAWAISIVVTAIFVAGVRLQPTPSEAIVIGVLGVVLALPVALVAVGWLLGVIDDSRRHPAKVRKTATGPRD